MFHTHFFTQSEKDPEILYCRCGETKDIHRHLWVESHQIETESIITNNVIRISKVLKCKICGDMKIVKLS